MNGKGDTRRPMQIPPDEFDQRWAETFGVAARFAAEMAEGRWEYDPWEMEFATALGKLAGIPLKQSGQFTNRDPDAS